MLTSPRNRIYGLARKGDFAWIRLPMHWPEASCSGWINPMKAGELLYPEMARLRKQWHTLLSSWIANTQGGREYGRSE